MKKTDEEILLLFLIMLLFMEQNKRLTVYRLLFHSFLLVKMRILEIQSVAVQHFITSYDSRWSWVYHKRENDFAEYLADARIDFHPAQKKKFEKGRHEHE